MSASAPIAPEQLSWLRDDGDAASRVRMIVVRGDLPAVVVTSALARAASAVQDGWAVHATWQGGVEVRNRSGKRAALHVDEATRSFRLKSDGDDDAAAGLMALRDAVLGACAQERDVEVDETVFRVPLARAKSDAAPHDELPQPPQPEPPVQPACPPPQPERRIELANMVRVGAGALGDVYRVDDAGEPRALKVVHLSRSHPLEVARNTFALMRGLPPTRGLVRLVGGWFDEDSDSFCELMEWCSGGTLRGLLDAALVTTARTTLPPITRLMSSADFDALLIAMCDLVCALCALAEHSLVHCDIKPENVLLRCPNGELALAGFGSVRTVAQLELGEDVPGTLMYMSPEQATRYVGDQATDMGATDVYTLGLVLTEMITLTLPSELDWLRMRGGSSPTAVMREVARITINTAAVRQRIVTVLGAVGLPKGSEELASLIAAMLSRDPAGRPTPAQVRQRLEGAGLWRSQTGVDASPSPVAPGRSPVPAAAAAPAAASAVAAAPSNAAAAASPSGVHHSALQLANELFPGLVAEIQHAVGSASDIAVPPSILSTGVDPCSAAHVRSHLLPFIERALLSREPGQLQEAVAVIRWCRAGGGERAIFGWSADDDVAILVRIACGSM